MLGFLFGALFGGAVGVTTMCLCSAASEADRYTDPQGYPPNKNVK
ncbi:MAG: DUF3789 domain-containing protein [Ruminococcus sp.]|nr:DUF3789 domain-containing protein [Ruminococcus sp.]